MRYSSVWFKKNLLLCYRGVLQLDSYSWSKDIENIVSANPAAIIEKDSVTGLYPFLLAAVRKCDLDSGFELMLRTPHFFRQMKNNVFVVRVVQ